MFAGLMSVRCVIRRSRNTHQYALLCTAPLFSILAPTCFSSSLPSSESFLDPSKLLQIQIEWVVYHIVCGYVTCVLECRGSNVWLRGLCAGVSWFQCVVTWPVCWSVVVPMCGYVACVLECRGSNVWLRGLCAGVSWFQCVVTWAVCWSVVVTLHGMSIACIAVCIAFMQTKFFPRCPHWAQSGAICLCKIKFLKLRMYRPLHLPLTGNFPTDAQKTLF
jgi:hypothetical protein